jgi:hypothetical protein
MQLMILRLEKTVHKKLDMHVNKFYKLWVQGCLYEEAIFLTYGRLVVLHGCFLLPEIMHPGAPKVFPVII